MNKKRYWFVQDQDEEPAALIRGPYQTAEAANAVMIELEVRGNVSAEMRVVSQDFEHPEENSAVPDDEMEPIKSKVTQWPASPCQEVVDAKGAKSALTAARLAHADTLDKMRQLEEATRLTAVDEGKGFWNGEIKRMAYKNAALAIRECRASATATFNKAHPNHKRRLVLQKPYPSA